MQSVSRFTRRLVLSTCAAAALLLGVGVTVHGSDATKVTYLTFSQAVSVPGVVLPAGQYTFEALRADIVRVSSRDRLRVFYTGYTDRVRRPETLKRDVSVAFAEAAAGQPKPIDVWYPEQASMGFRFLYR